MVGWIGKESVLRDGHFRGPAEFMIGIYMRLLFILLDECVYSREQIELLMG